MTVWYQLGYQLGYTAWTRCMQSRYDLKICTIVSVTFSSRTTFRVLMYATSSVSTVQTLTGLSRKSRYFKPFAKSSINNNKIWTCGTTFEDIGPDPFVLQLVSTLKTNCVAQKTPQCFSKACYTFTSNFM